VVRGLAENDLLYSVARKSTTQQVRPTVQSVGETIKLLLEEGSALINELVRAVGPDRIEGHRPDPLALAVTETKVPPTGSGRSTRRPTGRPAPPRLAG